MLRNLSLEEIDLIVGNAIQSKVFPGCVFGYLDADDRYIKPYGRYSYIDSMYDVASVTKSIPTATLASMLIEQGKLSLDDKVTSYLLKSCFNLFHFCV
jgi:CubicO group peptidase (beta-lactamase class C family)